MTTKTFREMIEGGPTCREPTMTEDVWRRLMGNRSITPGSSTRTYYPQRFGPPLFVARLSPLAATREDTAALRETLDAMAASGGAVLPDDATLIELPRLLWPRTFSVRSALGWCPALVPWGALPPVDGPFERSRLWRRTLDSLFAGDPAPAYVVTKPTAPRGLVTPRNATWAGDVHPDDADAVEFDLTMRGVAFFLDGRRVDPERVVFRLATSCYEYRDGPGGPVAVAIARRSA